MQPVSYATSAATQPSDIQLVGYADWRGQQVRVSTDYEDMQRFWACQHDGHKLDILPDEYGNPSGFLMCRHCFGIADQS